MDVHDQLNEIAATVRGAKAMPMSASCLVNRTEILAALERVRDVLPVDLDHADALLSDREAVVASGREEAECLSEATRLLADADDYVDRKLGEFEVVLGQLGSQVNNGRERLAARRETDLARIEALVEGAPHEVDAHPGLLLDVDPAFGRTPSPPVI